MIQTDPVTRRNTLLTAWNNYVTGLGHSEATLDFEEAGGAGSSPLKLNRSRNT